MTRYRAHSLLRVARTRAATLSAYHFLDCVILGSLGPFATAAGKRWANPIRCERWPSVRRFESCLPVETRRLGRVILRAKLLELTGEMRRG